MHLRTTSCSSGRGSFLANDGQAPHKPVGRLPSPRPALGPWHPSRVLCTPADRCQLGTGANLAPPSVPTCTFEPPASCSSGRFFSCARRAAAPQAPRTPPLAQFVCSVHLPTSANLAPPPVPTWHRPRCQLAPSNHQLLIRSVFFLRSTGRHPTSTSDASPRPTPPVFVFFQSTALFFSFI